MTYWSYPGVVKVIPSEEHIIKKVCAFYNITRDQIKMKTRNREIVLPRQIACKLIKDSGTNLSLRAIGVLVGGLDHATVLHAIKTVDDLLQTDKNFRAQFSILKNSL